MKSTSSCPLYTLLDFLSMKRVIMIVKAIYEKNHTFTAIRASIEGISANLLTNRLTLLCEKGFVVKEVDGVQSVKITYTLSKKGEDLAQVIQQLLGLA